MAMVESRGSSSSEALARRQALLGIVPARGLPWWPVTQLAVDLSKLPPGLKLRVTDPAALENPEVQAQIRELIERIRVNPLLGYYPHVKQTPFHAHVTKIRTYLGGERSGKTLAGVLQDLIDAVDTDVLPPHLRPFKIWQPPFYCRIVTPDFGQGMGEMLKTMQQWVPPAQLYRGSWEEAYSDKKHELMFANGSFFDFMTCEQDVSKFGGTSRHRIHYDEEPKGTKGEEIREANVNRLVEYRGDELFTFSPVHGLGWTYDSLWEARGEEVEPDVWVSPEMILVRADQDDNPHLDEEGKREAAEKIPEHMQQARKSGYFVHAQGLVYPMFDRDLHVCEKLSPEFVQGLDCFESIDPGIQTTAVIFGGFDSENRLWIYDELYLHDRWAVPENAAQKILAKRAEWGVNPKRSIIDPAAQSRNVQTNIRTDKAYKEAGIRVRAARSNDVEAGVFEVMRRLEHSREAEVEKGVKVRQPFPLLIAAENCKKLLWEIGRYRQDPKDDGSFGVVKKDDHLADCVRYLGPERPLLKRKRRPPNSKIYRPGTAPAGRKRLRRQGAPMGKYS